MARRALENIGRWAAVALALIVSPTSRAGPARAADAGCYSNWSEAAPIVSREGLLTVEQLTASARGKLAGDIVKTTLCKEGGGYVYRLVVRGPNGQLTSATVDAKAGFGN